MKILKYLKCFFRGQHIYGDGVMNPFRDIHNNPSAIYTCIHCGHQTFKTFERK